MSRLNVKICGLSRAGSVAAALDGGASHLGFIFFEPSPRSVTADKARQLTRPVSGRAVTVAVTVDADDRMLDEIVAGMEPGMLQLHGHESPARIDELKKRYGLPVMKAIPVRETGDLDAVKEYRGVADIFLLDAKPPAGSQLPGGNGIAFDWSLLADLDRKIEYMLSGGIGTGNVEEALSVARPAGIDISSGVEIRPGVKDDEKIIAVLRQIRRIEQAISV